MTRILIPLAVSISFLLGAAPRAEAVACYNGKEIAELEIIPDDQDTRPPGTVTILDTEIIRGEDTTGTLCVSVGSLGFTIEPPTDDVSAGHQLGYLVEIVSEEGFPVYLFSMNAETIPEPGETIPVKAEGDVVWVNFYDRPKKTLDATFTLAAVDQAGNVSEKSSPVRITDPGIGGGCSTTGQGSASTVLLLAVACWFTLRRRT